MSQQMIEQIKVFMRPLATVSKSELEAYLGVGPKGSDKAQFGLALSAARVELEKEGIFFKPARAGVLERIKGDSGADTVARQCSGRSKAARNALARALAKAQAAVSTQITNDVQRLARLQASADRLQMQAAHVELFVGKRKF